MGARLNHILKRTIDGLWIGTLAAVITLVVASHVAPMLGYSVFIVRGASMTPTVPLGALLIDQKVAPSAIRVGDLITFQGTSNVVVSHRVVDIISTDGHLSFRVRGDANATADPNLVPELSVLGREVLNVPLGGYLLAMLSVPTGIVSILSMVGSLFTTSWLLEVEAKPQTGRWIPGPPPLKARTPSRNPA